MQALTKGLLFEYRLTARFDWEVHKLTTESPFASCPEPAIVLGVAGYDVIFLLNWRWWGTFLDVDEG
jgi:hypothetical protein